MPLIVIGRLFQHGTQRHVLSGMRLLGSPTAAAHSAQRHDLEFVRLRLAQHSRFGRLIRRSRRRRLTSDDDAFDESQTFHQKKILRL